MWYTLFANLAPVLMRRLPKLPLRDGNRERNSGISSPPIPSETSSKGWKHRECTRKVQGNHLPKLPLRDGNRPRCFHPGGTGGPSETSSKGWKQTTPQPVLIAVRLPKLPLRDGNCTVLCTVKFKRTASETSSKGWKPGHGIVEAASRLPSETSSKGWKLLRCERRRQGGDFLPKLPLRDGNHHRAAAGRVRYDGFRNFL